LVTLVLKNSWLKSNYVYTTLWLNSFLNNRTSLMTGLVKVIWDFGKLVVFTPQFS